MTKEQRSGEQEFAAIAVAADKLNELLNDPRIKSIAGITFEQPDGGGGGVAISGTNCSGTGPRFSPNDFNCGDKDP